MDSCIADFVKGMILDNVHSIPPRNGSEKSPVDVFPIPQSFSLMENIENPPPSPSLFPSLCTRVLLWFAVDPVPYHSCPLNLSSCHRKPSGMWSDPCSALCLLEAAIFAFLPYLSACLELRGVRTASNCSLCPISWPDSN